MGGGSSTPLAAAVLPPLPSVCRLRITSKSRRPIHLRQVEVFGHDDEFNHARKDKGGVARQSSTHCNKTKEYGPQILNDGDYETYNHTKQGCDEWVEVIFLPVNISRLVIYNRRVKEQHITDRADGLVLEIFDATGEVVFLHVFDKKQEEDKSFFGKKGTRTFQFFKAPLNAHPVISTNDFK